MYKELNKEQRLIMLLSRIKISEEQIQVIIEIIKGNNVDWNYIITVAAKNKVLGLMWNNMDSIGCQEYIPRYIIQLMKYYTIGVSNRVRMYMKEMNIIVDELEEAGINCALLKGAYFIPKMYGFGGSRNLNDIDLLIKSEDAGRVQKVMNSLGYIQGEYNNSQKAITVLDRKKQILWKSKMNNMAAFIKLADSEYINCYKFDFCFAIDLQRKIRDVDEMLDVSVAHELNNVDFLLHLCCHFYKEAVNIMWIYNGNDVNIMKVCDIYEFIRNKMSENDVIETIKKAQRKGYIDAVYYSLFFVAELYPETSIKRILSAINIESKEIINEYGKNDLKKAITWEKNIWERLFSITNRDELKDNIPKYKLLD